MAGGGDMGGMPQGGAQQGSMVGMPVGPGMGAMGGLGMGGMGFGGGQPGMGAPQGMGMPQGDTFQPQNPSQGLSMAQIGQMLRGLQGGQMQQMPQVAPQYSASPSMQQSLPQQPASQIAQDAYRGFLGKPGAPQSMAQPQQTIPQQQMTQAVPSRRLFGAQQPSQGIASIPTRSEAMQGYQNLMSRRRVR